MEEMTLEIDPPELGTCARASCSSSQVLHLAAKCESSHKSLLIYSACFPFWCCTLFHPSLLHCPLALLPPLFVGARDCISVLVFLFVLCGWFLLVRILLAARRAKPREGAKLEQQNVMYVSRRASRLPPRAKQLMRRAWKLTCLRRSPP